MAEKRYKEINGVRYEVVPNPDLGSDIIGLTSGLSADAASALIDCFEHVAWTVDNGQEYVDALIEALYGERTLVSISAVYTQSGTVYDTDSLEDLVSDLVVTAYYDDESTEVLSSDEYILSGSLQEGTSVITVSYEGKTATFNVTVTHTPGTYTVTNTLTGCTNSNTATYVTEEASYSGTLTPASGYTMTGASVTVTMDDVDITAEVYSAGVITIASVTGNLIITAVAVAVTLESISAVYTQSGTVYDTDSLDSLKSDLVVTATYSDSSTATIPSADYTLSGTLTVGTSTVTVNYGGQTTTFTVTVTHMANGLVNGTYDKSGKWSYTVSNNVLTFSYTATDYGNVDIPFRSTIPLHTGDVVKFDAIRDGGDNLNTAVNIGLNGTVFTDGGSFCPYRSTVLSKTVTLAEDIDATTLTIGMGGTDRSFTLVLTVNGENVFV